ncbi:MAG: PAS domain S-box protein, partial [Candidatus Heimdallarchaeota archaeon]
VIVNNLGYSKEEILRMKATDFLNVDENIKEIKGYIEVTVQTGVVRKPKTYKVKKKDGTLVYLEVNTIPLKKNGDVYAILGIGHDVSGFKKLEQKIRESEEKYRNILENTTDTIVVTRFDGKHLFVSPQYSQLLGYSVEEASKVMFDLIHPEDRQKIMNFYKESVDKKQIIIEEIEQRWKHKNGHYIWVATSSKNYYNENGEVIGWITSIRDITDRKIAEKQLIESEERFKALFKGSPIPTLTWQKIDDDFVLIDYNKALKEYSQDDISQYLEINASIFFRDQPEILKDLHRCLDEKVNISREIKYFVNILKEERDLSAKFAYIPPDLVLLHIEDITEQRKSESKLRESEEKFRSITEQSFMGIFIIQDGRFKYLNKTMEKISGYSVEEMLTWSNKEIAKLIHADDLDSVLLRLERNRNSLQSDRENIKDYYTNNSFRIIHRNGEIRWLEDYTTRILYQGVPANLISVVDVSEKKEAEQLIIEENNRLTELHELRKDLITRVSHELKTPMTSIYGANQILTRLYLDEIGEEAQNYIEIGLRGCLRMKQLIDNLLDVSRLDAKKLDLRLQEENLIDLIFDCIKDMNYLATDRQLKIRLDLPEEAFVNLDRLRFRQVLSNLMSNAIKNTPASGEILIKVFEENDHFDISIKDTGVGITEKEKTKLFEKFGKIERYGMDLDVDIEGSGLGLYISKEIVELHGGQISLESEGRNKGSTFKITLFK